MARLMNYDKKIEAIRAKIETKQSQIKTLKAQLAEYEKAQAENRIQDISEAIQKKGLNPQDVLNLINEHFQ
jgi:predicted  nucleic acid-binding Zn-ribbon protein